MTTPNCGSPPKKGQRAHVHTSESAMFTPKKAASIDNDISPLDVIRSYMNFLYREVQLFDAQISKAIPKGKSILQLERTPVIDAYLRAREKLFNIALKAAPYCHPRFLPVAHKESKTNLNVLTDDELDVFLRLHQKMSGAPKSENANSESVTDKDNDAAASPVDNKCPSEKTRRVQTH